LFNSVSDSLFKPNDPQNNHKSQNGQKVVNLKDLHRFQLSLTLEFEFDYLELYTPMEVVEFLKEMHLSIMDKPYRKELSMYSRKGFKPGHKAKLQGFNDELSLTYISWLMCIPAISETKAIAIAKVYPTYKQLMDMLTDPTMDEKNRKLKLQEIEMAAVGGEKSKKVGKALAEKLYFYFMSADPNVIIS